MMPRGRTHSAGMPRSFRPEFATFIPTMLTLERFSIGVGDRFAHQAKAQLHAFQLLAMDGYYRTLVDVMRHGMDPEA